MSENNIFYKIDKRFVELCFIMDNVIGNGNLIDSYSGEAFSSAKKLSLEELKDSFLSLKSEVIDYVEDVFPLFKRTYLTSHIDALLIQIDLLQGIKPNFKVAVDKLYDTNSTLPTLSSIETLHNKLLNLFLQKGAEKTNLKQQVIDWKVQNAISTEKFVDGISEISSEYKQKTFNTISNLFDGIDNIYNKSLLKFEIVNTSQGWGAYNSYFNNYTGKVLFNSNAKFNRYSIRTFLSHEGYPGHHTSAVIKEYLYRNHLIDNYATLNLLKTPSSLIEEGIGDCGLKILTCMPTSIDDAIEKTLDDLSAEVDCFVAQLIYNNDCSEQDLYQVLLDYKFMRDKEDAERSINFIRNWNLYVPIYKLGREVISSFIENHSSECLKYLYYPCTEKILQRLDKYV